MASLDESLNAAKNPRNVLIIAKPDKFTESADDVSQALKDLLSRGAAVALKSDWLKESAYDKNPPFPKFTPTAIIGDGFYRRRDGICQYNYEPLSTKDLLGVLGLSEHDTVVIHIGAPDKVTRHAGAQKVSGPICITRKLLNTQDVLDWAAVQGIAIGDLDKLHVTVCYSRAPVLWDALPATTSGVVAEGGVRSVEPLDMGAIVLRFQSNKLDTRWHKLMEHGISHDYDHYNPHITLNHSGAMPPTDVEPYAGPLRFGEEQKKPISDVQIHFACQGNSVDLPPTITPYNFLVDLGRKLARME
jgi:hypothetical protein